MSYFIDLMRPGMMEMHSPLSCGVAERRIAGRHQTLPTPNNDKSDMAVRRRPGP